MPEKPGVTPSAAPARRGLRVTLTVLAVVAAAGLIAYGVLVHSTTVLVEGAPAEPPPPVVSSDLPPGLPPPFVPPGPSEPEIVELELSEPEITLDVTVGGLERLEDGRIVRTYSGEAPEACPT